MDAICLILSLLGNEKTAFSSHRNICKAVLNESVYSSRNYKSDFRFHALKNIFTAETIKMAPKTTFKVLPGM
jgi:hypothetical protein